MPITFFNIIHISFDEITVSSNRKTAKNEASNFLFKFYFLISVNERPILEIDLSLELNGGNIIEIRTFSEDTNWIYYKKKVFFGSDEDF